MPYDDEKNPTSSAPTFAILGAGFSGLCMAIKLREKGFSQFTIFEKANEVGGTWRENTYPGVACDVPSHLYSFSFEPNPDWSERFSPGGEIQEYLKGCARKYDLYEHIEFGKTVSAVRHVDGKWRIEFKEGEPAFADYLISGLGGLHAPSVPSFPGKDTFKGPAFHTAEWRHDVPLEGKRVAIIGSAASAVQVIPAIVDKVGHLDVYQRTPNWIMTRESYSYPRWAKGLFRAVPFLARLYRGAYFSYLEWRFNSFKTEDSYSKRMITARFEKHMKEQVKDPELLKTLTPDYPVGCKRLLISDDYLPAIQKENVSLVTEGIEAITETGVRTVDGEERSVDVIVYATGFVPFDILDAIEIEGPGGRNLKESWDGEIRAHRTIATPGFPNFFMLLGPNSGLGHNSVILMIEAQVNYIVDLVHAAEGKGAAFVSPKPEAAARFDLEIQSALQDRVWAAQCGAWYVDENGRNYTLYPHSVRHFLKEMKTPNLDEYELTNAAVTARQTSN